MEEDSTLGTPFQFGTGVYLYPHTRDFSTPFDPTSFQVPIDSLGQILGPLTMDEQPSTSQTISSDAATSEYFVSTSSMFYTTPE